MSEMQTDLDKRCRTCLEANSNDVSLNNKVTVDGEEVMLSEILFSCTGLHVNSRDHKPQSICINCSRHARTLYQFQAICIQSDFTLQKEIENCVDKYFQEEPSNTPVPATVVAESSKPNKIDWIDLNEQPSRTIKSTPKTDESDDETDSKTHPCYLCGKSYRHKRTLNKHLREYHRRLHSFTDVIGVCTCKLCGKTFHELKMFMNHLKQHATGDTAPELETFMKSEAIDSLLSNMADFDKFLGVDTHVLQSVARLGRDPFDFGMDDETEALLHSISGPGEMEVHDGRRKRRTHACSECDARFDSNVLMKKHMNSEHGEFSCLVCGAIFFEESDLRRHEVNHCKEDVVGSDVKKHVCEHCGSAFLKPVYLQIHMRKHSGEKPFKCSECDARFALPSTLSYHKKRHSNSRELMCETCGQAFKYRKSLQDHLLSVHSDEATVKCTVCDNMFKSYSLMSSHRRTYHSKKVFSCTMCEKTFARQATLTLHIKAHTGERYACKICDKRFIAPSVLRYHMKTQHTENTG